ncbi:hypothetical protein E3Q23_00092 [Wallemia mellicola]|uniref:LSM complex subunit LSM4 n=2 Tax=Wallemia mellicola TaxID=1708541 RepID=A0A4T0U1R7_9BASI|nr:hypothetical protein E3Q24_00386 [Wallemia mellicola]TIB79534.1 hypothetical protein E3Q23_00092 [Wallemia mellicola]TIC26318.1 Sm-like ribonucleo protein [Wallemia mellicola]TIC70058.1 Sm-like ribonucleo protein [Wallemia mellicola]TIC71711.1 Sm-like ribonucleo protein [Wallemia mellicola]
MMVEYELLSRMLKLLFDKLSKSRIFNSLILSLSLIYTWLLSTTMLPLTLLNGAQNKPLLVELKSGETFNGHLIACDNYMNLTLKQVFQTNADGERFWKLPECYLRGNTIKYIRVADELLDQIKTTQDRDREQYKNQRTGSERQERGRGRGRGGRGRGGRGRGRGGQQNN